MSNIPILDGTAGTAYLSATGTGTNQDPFIPLHNSGGTVGVSAGTVTASQAGAWNVGGTVNIGNLPASQIVSGTVSVGNLPASQPITGTVSVAAGTVNLSGTIAWTSFHSTYAASGDGTPIPAVAGSAIWIQELDAISGQVQSSQQIVILKHGTAVARTIPMSAVLDGAVWDKSYPDYIKLPVNTALIVNMLTAGTVHVYGRYCYQPG